MIQAMKDLTRASRSSVNLSGIPMLRQPDGITCGATAAAMAILGSGNSLPGRSIAALATEGGVNKTTGTGEVQMARMLEAGHTRWRRGVARDVAGLRASMAMGQAVLLRLIFNTMPHWRVAVGFEQLPNAGTVLITHCPSIGRVLMTESELTRHWEPRDCDHFVVEVESERSARVPAYPYEALEHSIASPIYRLSESAHGLSFYRHFGFGDNRLNSVSIVAFDGEQPVARITRNGFDSAANYDRQLIRDLLMAVGLRDRVFMDTLTANSPRQSIDMIAAYPSDSVFRL